MVKNQGSNIYSGLATGIGLLTTIKTSEIVLKSLKKVGKSSQIGTSKPSFEYKDKHKLFKRRK